MTDKKPKTAKNRRTAAARNAENLEYYKALLWGWLHNRLIIGKIIAPCSAGGLALLVAWLFPYGGGLYLQTLWLGAFIALALALFLSLVIFRRNSNYIAMLLDRHFENDSFDEAKLNALDERLRLEVKIANNAFYAGVSLTGLLAFEIGALLGA